MSIMVRTDIRSEHIEAMLRAAGARAPRGIARALNRAGRPTSTAYLRQAKKTLGIRNWRYGKTSVDGAIRRATNTRRATAGRLTYSLSGWGSGLNLAYYQPKEGPQGATVNWLGTRRMIARSFYLGGQFPRRRVSRISHSVWQRTGRGKWALDRPKGPGLPEAMVHPVPANVWRSSAAARLPDALANELRAILSGFA